MTASPQPAPWAYPVEMSPEDSQAFVYFTQRLLPLLAHRNANSRFRNQSYFVAMSLQSPSVMNGVVAYSGICLSQSNPSYGTLALRSYSTCLLNLRNDLSAHPDDSTGDTLLATILCICLFEDALMITDTPNIVAHLPAMKHLLQTRAKLPSKHGLDQIFERTCVETLLFYNVMSLLLHPDSFDGLYNMLEQLDYAQFIPREDTSCDNPDGTASMEPVLAISYKFFLLIADIMRLVRQSGDILLDQSCVWGELDEQLRGWEDFFCYDRQSKIRNPPGHLAARALRALLLSADPDLSDTRKEDELVKIKQDCLTHIDTAFSPTPLSKYAIWQLALVGSMALDGVERNQIRSVIQNLRATQPSGLVNLASRRLERQVWISSGPATFSTPCLAGIRLLCRGGPSSSRNAQETPACS